MGFKLGKQPKRFGGPSQKFLHQKADPFHKEQTITPKEGDVRIYLDDERPCPKDWTLVRDPHAFFKLLDDPEIAKRVTSLSLDWYLGVGVASGLDVAKKLAKAFTDNSDFLPNVQVIAFHSSDHHKAREMFQTIYDVLSDERKSDLYLNIGSFTE